MILKLSTSPRTYADYIKANGIMFGFDSRHRRQNPYEQGLSLQTVSHLAPKWSFSTGDSVRSSPIVVDGVVYVGSNDKNLYAIDAATGSKKWSFPTGDTVVSSPAVIDEVIYIGSERKLYALDATTGSKKWAVSTGDSVDSSPVVVNGVVYVGSDDKNLYALDAVDGNKRWVFPTRGSV